MFDKIREEYTRTYHNEPNVSHKIDSKNIVDDLILYGDDPIELLRFCRIVLKTLEKYRVTVNLKKCRFFSPSATFAGVDLTAEGNSPSEGKFKDIRRVLEQPPITTRSLYGVIGLFNFYSFWIPWYEVRIARWRDYYANRPVNDHGGSEDRKYLEQVWGPHDYELLKELVAEVLDKPVLARPDFTRRFYLKTDWSKSGMGAVLCQADPDDDIALKAEQDEIKGGPCLFDKTLSAVSLRLRPIAFLS